MFFPRGGSAHVARALATELPAHGWDVTVVSGSCSGGHGDARTFYEGLDPPRVDFDAGGAPMPPSYEDRPDAPDRVFAAVDDAGFEEHVAAWSAALTEAGAAGHDVLHLHHLTPIHEAAARVAPGVPVVTHLHGTELLMLEEIAGGAPGPRARRGAERRGGGGARRGRRRVLAPPQSARPGELLGGAPAKCGVTPNGFPPERFDRLDVDRRALWRRVLVDEPSG